MLLIRILIFANIFLLVFHLFGGDVYLYDRLFAREKSQVYAVNLEIIQQRQYNDLLRSYDRKFFNFSRLQYEEERSLEDCKLPQNLPTNNYPQFSVLLQYEDFLDSRYTEVIKCNIVRSLFQDITIVVDYSSLLDDSFNRDILWEFEKLGYRFHWVVKISEEDMESIRNILNIIRKPATLTLFIEEDATQESLELLLEFYVYYYEDVEIYVGGNGRNIKRLPYTVRYLTQPLNIGPLREENIIKQHIIQNYNIQQSIDYLQLPQSLHIEQMTQENPNILLSIPNAAFLFKDLAEESYIKNLDKEYNKLDVIDREYIKLKYRTYFLTK